MENTSSSQSTALAASTTTSAPSRPPAVQQPAASSAGSGGGSAPSKNRREKRGGRRDGAGGNPAPTGTQPGAQSSVPSGGQFKPGSSGSWGAPWPSFYRPWAGAIQMWPGPQPGQRPPLAPPLGTPQRALLAQQTLQQHVVPAPVMENARSWTAPPPGFYQPHAGLPTWDQPSLASTFSTMTLQQPQNNNDRYFDSGATSHISSHSNSLSHTTSSRYPAPSSIVVGNGSLLPVTSTGCTVISPSLCLNNVLVSP